MPLRTVRDLKASEAITFRCYGCQVQRSWTRAELMLAVGAGQDLHHIGLHPQFSCNRCRKAPSSAWFNWQSPQAR